jgi:hypothetical protein
VLILFLFRTFTNRPHLLDQLLDVLQDRIDFMAGGDSPCGGGEILFFGAVHAIEGVAEIAACLLQAHQLIAGK